MDFFEAQDRARRKTGKLVVLYVMAVLSIIVTVYLVAVFIFGFTSNAAADISFVGQIWQPELFLTISAILAILIISGTIFRIIQLRKGGSAVAEMLGGRKLESSTRDPHERQLINVVEEMAIASGLPVPDIYILDNEENINAFAAGFEANDAAVGVTRGALVRLDRNELQGVIAHEFSHIFNGDMRLNIRLIGILNGILMLHLTGMILMRSAAYSRIGRGSGRGGGQAAIAILLFGLILLIVGYIGMLFGRIIQAAISRQREYLADAAAVQYTRNPNGIAGALRKIGQIDKGSNIKDGHAMELSHLFFANSYFSALDHLFATHPPLENRIRAIDPSFDREDEKKKLRIRKRLEKDRVARAMVNEQKPGVIDGGMVSQPALRPEVILAAIGTLEGSQVEQAGHLIDRIPQKLREASHEPLGAEALVCALLLSGREPSAEKVPDWLDEELSSDIIELTGEYLSILNNGKREWFLPLAEMALPALRQMSRVQFEKFRTATERLIREDDSLSLFEFAIQKLIVHKLEVAFSHKKEPVVRHYHFKTLGEELSVLLSAMALASEKDTRKSWESGCSAVKAHLPEDIRLMSAEECTVERLERALDEFSVSAFPVKKYVLKALIHCMLSDNRISVRERELLRVISESIDCPVPLMDTI